MAKFKKGDKVYFARSINPSPFDPLLNTHGVVDEDDSQVPYVLFELRDGNHKRLAMIEDELELVSTIPAYSIHITADGPITHAVYKEGNKIVRRAKAVCNPEDKYDFRVGARLAVNRLLGTDYKPEDVALTKPSTKPEKIKLYCIKAWSGNLTKGKVYDCTAYGSIYNITLDRDNIICSWKKGVHYMPFAPKPRLPGRRGSMGRLERVPFTIEGLADALEEYAQYHDKWKDQHYDDLMTAAAYLREYSRAQPDMGNPITENNPLTLEELKQMDGEPVWVVEYPKWGHWELSEDAEEYVQDRHTEFYGMTHDDKYGKYGLHAMGWLAYRHKPEGCGAE